MHLKSFLFLSILCLSVVSQSKGQIENFRPQSTDFTMSLTPDFFNQERLILEPAEGVEYSCIRDRIERHPVGSYSWAGKIEGNQQGYVIISKYEQNIFGKIRLNDGRQYLMRSITENNMVVCRLVEVEIQDEECSKLRMEEERGEEENLQSRAPNVCDEDSECAMQILNIAVFWSPAASSNMGGNAASIAEVTAAVTEINTVSTNSDVDHEFSLVVSEEVSYTESGSFGTDLNRFRDDNDGQMDQVHAIRDANYADIMALILGSGGCGLGNVNTNPDQYDAQSAFSVSSDNCMTTNLTLAHEVGHNIGFGHDIYAYTEDGDPLPNYSCDWVWGWVNPEAEFGPNSARWRTTMAYNNQCVAWGFNCTRVPHWSNPDVNYNGDPTGSEIGNADESHNEHLFQRAACQIADFRVPIDCDSCLIYQGCSVYNSLTASGPGNMTLLSIDGPFPETDPNGTHPEVCVFYYGDHNNGLEQFEVLDEDLNLLGMTVTSFDCDIPNRVCFTIDPDTYSDWIADDEVEISLDPITTNINPTLCWANRACAELVVHDTSFVICDLMVTSTDNAGAGSLRNAIECANAGDTISFDISLQNETIETDLPIINVDKELFFIADASLNLTLSNASISNTDILVNLAENLTIKGLKLIGKSSDSFIFKISSGGNLTIIEGEMDKLEVQDD